MPKLLVIIASTRPGALGKPIGAWAADAARRHGGFDVEVVDLGDLGLPNMDEPGHPRMGAYVHQHTKDWAAIVDSAQAYLVVTPEYNYGPPPGFLNALDFLFWEWAYKPIGTVSYGGISGGLRSVQALKQVVTSLKMVPINDGVVAPFVMAQIQDGAFAANPIQEETLQVHLDEVLRWANALEPLRAEIPQRKLEIPPGAPKPPAGGPGGPGGPAGGPPPGAPRP